MRHISIDLSSDSYLEQPQIFGGYAGEHNETVLQVKLPQRMIDIECSGYRFDFQTSEDNKISSPLIPVSELNDGVLSFKLAEQLTVAGKLLFNIVAILSDENTVSLISKTNRVILNIEESPEGNVLPIDPNGYKDELQKMVDERVSQIEGHSNVAEDGTSNIYGNIETNEAGSKAFRIKEGSFINDVEVKPENRGNSGYYILGALSEDGKSIVSIENIDEVVNDLEKALSETNNNLIYNLWLFAPNDDVSNEFKDNYAYITNIEKTDDGYIKAYTDKYHFYHYADSNTEDGTNTGNTEGIFDIESFLRFTDYPLIGTEWLPTESVVFGADNRGLGLNSFTVGRGNVSNGAYSFTAGRNNYAGHAATTLGRNNKATAIASGVLAGEQNEATATDSVVIGGKRNKASATSSIAGGVDTEATGVASQSLGDNTKATRRAQTALGAYNKKDNDALLVVGNGTSNANRKNAFVVKDNGDVEIQGDIISNGVNLSASTEKAEHLFEAVDEVPQTYNSSNILIKENEGSVDAFIQLPVTNVINTPIWNGNTVAPTKGSGAEDDPYLIENGEHLAYIISTGGAADTFYKLTNDIYLNDTTKINWTNGEAVDNTYTPNEWYASTSAEIGVQGNFDGDGHTVYGLYYKQNSSGNTWYRNKAAGLFPRILHGGTLNIKRMGVDYAYLYADSAASAFVGAKNGTNNSAVTKDDCYIDITECYVGSNVTLDAYDTGAALSTCYGITITVIDFYSLATQTCRSHSGIVTDVYKGKATLTRVYNACSALSTKTGVTSVDSYATKCGDISSTLIRTTESMQGYDSLTNSDKMNKLGSNFVATNKYPVLKNIKHNWGTITLQDKFAEVVRNTAGDIESINISDKLLYNGKEVATKEYVDSKIIVSETDQVYSPESTNAQSGKAVAEAVSGKADVDNWRLVKTVTLTEAVKQITLNYYNLKKVRLFITNPSGSTGNFDLTILSPYNLTYTTLFVRKDYVNAYVDAWIENGKMFIEAHSGVSDYTQFQNYAKPCSADSIAELRFSANNGDFQKDTKIEMWGVNV